MGVRCSDAKIIRDRDERTINFFAESIKGFESGLVKSLWHCCLTSQIQAQTKYMKNCTHDTIIRRFQLISKGTQDPGQRLSTPVQFFKLWSHWSKNDGSNLGSHWWKYCLRICAKPNIWNNNNVRNWTFIVLQGVIRAVDQGKGSHQQAQPLPEVRVFYLAYLQKHLFALWMGSGEAQIWRWSEWDLGTWGLGSHESGEDEA